MYICDGVAIFACFLLSYSDSTLLLFVHDYGHGLSFKTMDCILPKRTAIAKVMQESK